MRFTVALISALAAAPSAAVAQTVLASIADPADIVVTAQRRAQSLQDVPISITALSGHSLQDSGIVRSEDLQFRVPSLTLLANNSPQGQLNLIRGVGTFSYSNAVEASVGTVTDGVVLGRQGMAFVNLFDVERVEVLKGPQGTLFGKNASAGLINIVTARPSFTPGVVAEASYGNYNDVLVNAAVTGPLSDIVAVRLSGSYDRRDGFVDQPVRGEKTGNLNRYGGRAKILIEPDATGSLMLTAEYSEVDERCCHWTVRQLGGQAPIIGAIVTAPGPDNRTDASEAPIGNRSKVFAAIADGRIDLSDALTLTSITGYRSWVNRNTGEADGTQLPILGAPGDVGRATYQQLSEEVRIASNPSRPLYFTAGLYYFTIDTKASGQTSGNLGAPVPPGFLFRSTSTSQSTGENYAAFGEVAARPVTGLLVTVGGRLLHDSVYARYARTGSFPLPGTTLGDTSSAAAKRGETNAVGRAIVQYDWTPRIMTYGSVSRGYKGYGADDTNPLPVFPAGGYGATFAKPETSLNYELGLRSQFLDRRLTINATAFRTDFRNFQTTIYDPRVGQYVLLNADRYRTQGVEIDASLRPLPGVTLSGAGAYTDARTRRFPNAICDPTAPSPGVPCVGGLRNVSGLRAPLAPEFAFNVAAEIEQPVGAHGVSLFGRLDYAWKDDVLFNFDQDPNKVQKAYGLLNGRIGVSHGAVRLSVYGRNLFDKRYTNLIFDTPIFGGYAQYPEIGRTYGVAIAMKF